MTPREIEIERAQRAAEALLEGLRVEYSRAIEACRVDLWSKAAHSIVELLASSAAAGLYYQTPECIEDARGECINALHHHDQERRR